MLRPSRMTDLVSAFFFLIIRSKRLVVDYEPPVTGDTVWVWLWEFSISQTGVICYSRSFIFKSDFKPFKKSWPYLFDFKVSLSLFCIFDYNSAADKSGGVEAIKVSCYFLKASLLLGLLLSLGSSSESKDDLFKDLVLELIFFCDLGLLPMICSIISLDYLLLLDLFLSIF